MAVIKELAERERIGQKIASMRQEAGLSQTELGKKCGLERFHIVSASTRWLPSRGRWVRP